ncbi:MAG: hypothetical protein FH753_08790 [Firmicutes bacterium]|nr:hypothetical protein [Bacillota bacterium]
MDSKRVKSKNILFGLISLLFLIIYIIIELFNYQGVISYFILFTILITLIFYIYNNHVIIYKELNEKKGSLINDIRNLSREQRHDYMNILQIIYGYLQIKKENKAVEHIKKVTDITQNISKVYALSIPSISLLLDKKIRKAGYEGVKFIYNINECFDTSYRDIENEKYIVNRLNEIINNIIDFSEVYNKKVIILKIKEDQYNLTFNIKTPFIKEDLDKLCGFEEVKIEKSEIIIRFKLNKPKTREPKDTLYSNIINDF